VKRKDTSTPDLFGGELIPTRPVPSFFLAHANGLWFRMCRKVNQRSFDVCLPAGWAGGYDSE
jgi:hypothetical protein